jgi:hypothetical protein
MILAVIGDIGKAIERRGRMVESKTPAYWLAPDICFAALLQAIPGLRFKS